MLTKLIVRNFKRFERVDVDLGEAVVLIGPNNSGKTSALQALALWELGVRRWTERREGKEAPEKRPGVTINRRDLISVPVPAADLLWRDLHVRDSRRVEGKPQTRNVRIDITVEGVTEGVVWSCGLEFDYANEESFYCRPLRLSEDKNPPRLAIPPQATSVRLAFLPPMSGLAAREDLLAPGGVALRVGEGRTAEVLRNLCFAVATGAGGDAAWERLAARIESLFLVKLKRPEFVAERGEITMGYTDPRGVPLDLSCAGRGLHQTVLLLAYMQANPGAVLLLDEPDAHLEVLRQRQIYRLLTEVGRESGNQIIAASHSEVVLNEAAERDVVVAFVGAPHRIDERASQVLKALNQIGFEHYFQAEVTGWVLYLEGSTDLAILQAFAETLDHPARTLLERPFVHYVGNQPSKARDHFFGLREAKPDLVGLALFDSDASGLKSGTPLAELKWHRREIESYLAFPEVLDAYATADEGTEPGPLFAIADREHRRQVMRGCVADMVPGVAQRDRSDRWWHDTKVTDDFLDRVFESYFAKLSLPNLMRKTDYHQLARLVRRDGIDPEVVEKLNAISETAAAARPRGG